MFRLTFACASLETSWTGTACRYYPFPMASPSSTLLLFTAGFLHDIAHFIS